MREPKCGIEIRRVRGRAIVVAKRQAVRHAASGQDIPGSGCSRQFRRIGGAAIHIIAQRHHIFDIAGGLICDHPIHLGVINGGIGGGVILRVGNGDECEISSCGALFAPIERNSQIAIARVAHMDGKSVDPARSWLYLPGRQAR